MSYLLLLLTFSSSATAIELSDFRFDIEYQPVDSSIERVVSTQSFALKPLKSDDDGFVKKMMQRQRKRFVSKFDHPGFMVPHLISRVGNVMMFGGTVAVVTGVGVFLVGVPVGLLLSDSSMVEVGFIMAAAGLGVFSGGLILSTVATLSSTFILRKKGVEVPLYGLLASASGLLVHIAVVSLVNVTEENLISYEEARKISGGALLAIPCGLIVQTIENRRAFNKYLDSISVTPVVHPDAFGLALRGTF